MTGYYPEMGEAMPVDTQIEASLGHYGRHYFLKTKLTLAAGRGVEALGTMTVAGGPRAGQVFNQYKVTLKAMEKLEGQYKVSSASML